MQISSVLVPSPWMSLWHHWRCNNSSSPSPVPRRPEWIPKPQTCPFFAICFPIVFPVILSVLLLSLLHAENLEAWPSIWFSLSSPWMVDRHALRFHPGSCCEPPRSTHGFCRRYSDASNTETRLYSFDLLKLHCYIVKLGFTGYTLFFSYFCSKT